MFTTKIFGQSKATPEPFSFKEIKESNFSLQDSVIKAGQFYTTRRIKFDLDKASLLSENSSMLDSLVSLLKRNPGTAVEVEVHADSRLSDKCCSDITRMRAESITNYLVEHGVKRDKLFAKGYGAKKLMVTDDQIKKAKTAEEKEVLHSINRRVVFRVIGITTGWLFTHPYLPGDSTFMYTYGYRTWRLVFPFNRSDTLTPDSYPLLDSLASFMKANENTTLEIGVHSITRGTEEYNSTMTQKRALTIADYFINKGIDNKRLFPKGYGKSNPLYKPKVKQEDDKQLARNQRVEFRILSTRYYQKTQ